MDKKFKIICYFMALEIGIISAPLALASNQQTHHPIIIKNSKHDLSMPLRDVPMGFANKKLQNSLNKVLSSSLLSIYGFQGIGAGLPSYTVKTEAPNVSGGVGRTQYLQWIDPDLAVFDKATGQIAPGFPKPGSAIWFGFGGPCETQNKGMPNVKYDQVANRWVITRQAYRNATSGPFYQCVAISTSEDATGSYYRYAFEMDSLNDYGKIGLWRDAYFLGVHMYGPVSMGPRVCALDRNSMLMGLPTSAQCFQLSDAESAPLLPADLGGTTLPPIGYPGYFFSIDAPQNLSLFKFYPDFTNPSNAKLSSAISLPVNNFVKSCAATGGNDCAVQPDTTNKLNILSDRFASRLIYRQFGDHGSFVASHNIQGPPPKLSPALRWYELRITDLNNPDVNPVLYQQQDFAPDSMNRYTGSLGVDKVGNIVMGYTVSSTLVHPSPELAYRNYYDPLNNLTLQALYTGLGSQTDISNWSLYSTMSLDPTDSCTFWFSSEYLQNSGSFNWSTIITHFKLPSCS